MNRAIYAIALLLAACGGGGDLDQEDPPPAIIRPSIVGADTLDSFEANLDAQVRAAPRPAVIAACGFVPPELHRIRLVAARYGLEVLGC